MAQFLVSYNIQVNSAQATQNLSQFAAVASALTDPSSKLNGLTTSLKRLNTVLSKLDRPVKFRFSAGHSFRTMDAVIRRLERIHELAKTPATLVVNGGGGSRTPSAPTSPHPTSVPKTPKAPTNTVWQKGMASPVGFGGMDFVKGMGIAYGLAGAGQFISGTVQDATEYDNIMATTRNILKTHDKQAGFERRFKEMEQTVRNVGIETKFTAMEVAGASKFLAMAGLNLEDINNSIRPIADIALVGDTELAHTADIVTNIMTAYNIKATQMRDAADQMTMTFTKTNTTLEELAESYKYAAGVLSASNVPFQDATAAIGVLGDAGIKASLAGTTMRNIALNLQNPTKKQAAAWETIGVSRLDANGKLRDWKDIFQDLHDKNVGAADMMKLFHKYAAAGSLALVRNIDKWKEVSEKNYQASGLSSKLADEKKNTVQGLWYQFTSSLTEAGMKAFESHQGNIKDILRDMVSWAQSGDFRKQLEQALLLVKDIAEGLMSILKTFAYMYERFGGVLKLWIKFQMTTYPIVASMKLISNLLGVIGVRAGVGGVAGSISVLTNALTGFQQSGKRSIAMMREFITMKNNMRASVKSMAGSMLPMLGAGAGAWLGSHVGEEGSMASGIGSLVGAGAGAMLMNPAVWSFLTTNPAGWATSAALAIGGLVWYLADLTSKTSEASASWREFSANMSAVTQNGASLSASASIQDKYWRIIEESAGNANVQLEKTLALFKELGEQEKGKMSGTTPVGVPLKSIFSKQYDALGKEYSGAIDSYMDTQFVFKNYPGITEYKNYTKHRPDFAKLNFTSIAPGVAEWDKFGFTIKDDASLLRSADAQLEMASIEVKKYLESTHYPALYRARSVEDVKRINSELIRKIAEIRKNIDPSTANLSLDEVMNFSNPERLAFYSNAFSSGLEQWGLPSGDKNNKMVQSQLALIKILKMYEQGVELKLDSFQEFLTGIGEPLADFEKYGELFSKEWVAKVWGIDSATGTLIKGSDGKTKFATARDAVEAMGKWYAHLQQQLEGMYWYSTSWGKNMRDMLETGAFSMSYWNAMVPKSGNGVKLGSKVNVNGKEYVAKADTDGVVKYFSTSDFVSAPVSLSEMGKLLNNEQNQLLANSTGGDGKTPRSYSLGGGRTGGSRASSSDYKRHYQNESSAPKQVIVTISNLMNVEKVDMSNADNQAVVANLKGQLAQALIDVVHDFDASFHG